MANATNLETNESGKSSVRVYPTPSTSRGGYKSATNPQGVGVATSKKGHTESK